jgi:hypothetical protein
MERRAALSAHRPSTRPPAEPPTTPPSERTAPVAAEQGTTAPPDQTAARPPERTAPTPPEQTAAIFWPEAARDLVDYVLLPRGNDRFWAYGYDAFVQAAFAPSNVDDRGPHSRPDGNQVSDAASAPTAPFSPSDRCGNVAADAAADVLIERIERVVEPSASQREALEGLRTAVAQVIERINATTCPGAAPATFAQRLTAIQDRIWVMHDALLTLRLPFETFNNALTDDQQRRLRGGAPGSTPREANATDGRAQTCADPAAGTAEGIMRAIERAARSAGQQRAGLDALRLNSAAMAKLVAGSCPADPSLSPMGRFAAATDRLDVMLFAVMSMSPALQQLYDSLDDKQRAGLTRALRQGRPSGPAGGRS